MFERQDLPTSEQPAAIVDKVIVDGLEHIHVNLRKFKFLQFHQAFIRLVKVDALAARNLVVLGAPFLLRLFVAKVVRFADFGKVVHILGAQLHLGKAAGQIVVENNMQRLVTRAPRECHRIVVIRPHLFIQQFRMTVFRVLRDFCRKAALFQEFRRTDTFLLLRGGSRPF